MSYNRKFSRKVKADYEGIIHVDFDPGTEERSASVKVEFVGEHTRSTLHSSGSIEIKDYAEEDVEVDIEVDTDPFDASVENCNSNVNGLTASVSAMNAAQCLAISENADKVSKSLIDGFFHTVKTDLATQKAELEQVIEARLILLRQQAATLKEKQQTMADDYARTTGRYQKIFADLNNELSVRIHQVDQPVFDLVNLADAQSDRMLHTDMIQTAVTMSKESSTLQAQIGVATVKNHALEAMQQAQGFLTSKALSERTIQQACIDGSGEDGYMVPVCYMRTESENNRVDRQCVMQDYYSAKNPKLRDSLCDRLEDVNFEEESENCSEQVKSYVQSEIHTHVTGDDSHSKRVRDMINKMLNK